MVLSRRRLLCVGSTAFVGGFIGAPFIARAQSAEFSYKYANNLSVTHPMNVRAREMADAIKAETNGRVEISIFPSSQLGSDTDTLSQIRSGAVEFFTLSGLILSTFVPAASINGIGFAFPDYGAVWTAMDGELGAYVRHQIAAAGLVPMETIWDNGFRQTTTSTKPISTPDDFRGLKLRVPRLRSGPRCSRRLRRRRPPSTSTKSIPRCRPESSTGRKTLLRSSRPQSSTRCRN